MISHYERRFTQNSATERLIPPPAFGPGPVLSLVVAGTGPTDQNEPESMISSNWNW